MKYIKKLIGKAIKAETELFKARSNIAIEAQEYIDWNENISCEYLPSDGLCISDGDFSLVPVSIFFHIVEEKGVMTKEDFYKNTI